MTDHREADTLTPPEQRADGSPRPAVRIALASVAVAAVCAGGVVFFGSAPAHHARQTAATSSRSDVYTGQLSSPPPWPSADPSSAVPNGAVDPGTGKASAGPKTSSAKSLSGGQAPDTSSDSGSQPGSSAKTSSHGSPAKPAPHPTSTPKPSGPIKVDGQVSCTSGKSVEGVWVQAAKGSGYSPWKGLGNGSTSDYWYTLPTHEPYSLHVGCGGTQANWAVAAETPTVPAGHNSFDCVDVAGQSGYETCRPR